ncbi:UNVERIFIED_CONTAM: hypothetical protein GTU68_042928 [Idotea baltica]|nr:hypothetical protein [Idotea baltica]
MPGILNRVDTSGATILYLEGVNVAFDGFKAINDLNFYVDKGELRCLIGANGAGKTTMMDIITGKTRPDSGIVQYGKNLDLVEETESDIALAGIGRKFQKPTVFEHLNVFENLELAMADNKSFWWNLRQKLNSEQHDRISQTANLIGLPDQQSQLAGSLSHGQKQWLEIGMLLMQEPVLLLIDEPVAGMTLQEMEKTGELLQSLAGDHTVIVVEHDMEFVRSIANRVTVLHQGSVLAEGTMDDIQNNADVRKVYLGE